MIKFITIFLISILLPILLYMLLKILIPNLKKIIFRKTNKKNNDELKIEYLPKNNLPFNDEMMDIKLEKPELKINKNKGLTNLQQQAELSQKQAEDGLVEEEKGKEKIEKKVTGFNVKGSWTKYVLSRLGPEKLFALIQAITNNKSSGFWVNSIKSERKNRPKTFEELIRREREIDRGYGQNNSQGPGM